MNGRKANDLKNALEDLTTIHKALGDEAISAKNYIAAVGQYTYALESDL